MKRFSKFLVVATLLLTAHTSFANINIPKDDEGPDWEGNEEQADNFFVLDVDDHFHMHDGVHRPDGQPCEGVITSEFGGRRSFRAKGKGRRNKRRGGLVFTRIHKGIDIAGPIGTPIVAPANGLVSFVGHKGAYGLTVVVDHGGELSTLYGHTSAVLVKEGDRVTKGQTLARVGNSGRSTGPHLHYEVRVDGVPVNPTKYF